MAKSFLLHCTGFTPKQADAFDDLLSTFFEEIMCDGRSMASYEWIDIRNGMEVMLQKKKPTVPLPTKNE